MTKCHSVRERVKNAFSRKMFNLVLKIFKNKTFTLMKSTNWNNLRFFTNTCTHLFKQILFDSKFFKLQRYSSVTLSLSPKIPISEGLRKITSTKIQILPRKNFPDSFGHKTIEPIWFWKDFMKNQLKLIFPKKCGFRSWKGSNIWTLLYSDLKCKVRI